MTDDAPPRYILMPTPGDLPCPVCDFPNTPQSEVCGVCGADLAGHTRPADGPSSAEEPPPMPPDPPRQG